MIQSNVPANPEIHRAACIIARRCRNIIQSCLREEEWAEADRAFYEIIREELELMKGGRLCGN